MAPTPPYCFHRGIWWDPMAAFPPGVESTERFPEAVLLDGTVADAAPAFSALLQ
jgi:hypothetical protein